MMDPDHDTEADRMSPQQSERTNVFVALVGLALVLLVLPLSSLLRAAVVMTMVGVGLSYLLTANPLQVVRSDRSRRDPEQRP
ncbi:hypothetical protein BH24ACT4_BH24ACT4_26720 [soil metagenome]